MLHGVAGVDAAGCSRGVVPRGASVRGLKYTQVAGTMRFVPSVGRSSRRRSRTVRSWFLRGRWSFQFFRGACLDPLIEVISSFFIVCVAAAATYGALMALCGSMLG